VTLAPPVPPRDLHARRLALRVIAEGTQLWRIHDPRRTDVWFGPRPGSAPLHRFDAPGGEFRVCYLGLTVEASFAETFLRNPGTRLLDRTLLEYRVLTPVTVTGRLRVARLYGPELARLGATAEVCHGPSYDLSRQWALALWSHPRRPDGILYKSRHEDDEICLALFDRREGDLRPGASQPLFRNRILPALLNRYRMGFNPSG
jgi:hypothetical protein